jgi:SAM-dependent methyltransferase
MADDGVPSQAGGAVRPRTGRWWEVHRRILAAWMARAFGAASPGIMLKTDLFDEASGPHHAWQDIPEGWVPLGIDVDLNIARAARQRLVSEGRTPWCVAADVRRLPLRPRCLAGTLSLSTLDHLESGDEIQAAIHELARVLRPDGRLLITLDNPLNLEVALRSRLPSVIVRRLRADTFWLGATVGSRRGSRMLARAGFSILQQSFVEHAPRYVTIRLAPRLASAGSRRMESLLVAAMHFLERLAGTPFSRLTGHYTAWIAVRTDVKP